MTERCSVHGKIKDKEKQPNNAAAMDVHSHSIDGETNVDVIQLRGIKGPLKVIMLRNEDAIVTLATHINDPNNKVREAEEFQAHVRLRRVRRPAARRQRLY